MRHRSRHLLRTLGSLCHAYLDNLGWIDEDGGTVLFGATAVTVLERELKPGELAVPNLVTVTIASGGRLLEEELGGGLMSITWDVFVDVYAENDSIMKALVDDLRDWLTDLHTALLDCTEDPYVATDNWISIEGVEDHDPPKVRGGDTTHWKVIAADAVVTFVG